MIIEHSEGTCFLITKAGVIQGLTLEEAAALFVSDVQQNQSTIGRFKIKFDVDTSVN